MRAGMHAVCPLWGWKLLPMQATHVGFCGGREAPEQTPVRLVPTGQAAATVHVLHTRAVEVVGGVL
jgi:hypothetical protein